MPSCDSAHSIQKTIRSEYTFSLDALEYNLLQENKAMCMVEVSEHAHKILVTVDFSVQAIHKRMMRER